MRISLLTVPVEPNYLDLVPKVNPGVDVFVNPRSQGPHPVAPKVAIVSILKWMERHGYGPRTYDYYDVDMELPTDERLARYFREYKPSIVGLSAVVSTCYYQVKRISRILREECPDCWIVLGGSLTASANLVLRKTDVDVCVVGDGEIAWVEFLDYVKERGRELDYEKLGKIGGLAYIENGEMQFTGYGRAIPAEDMPFPDYDILKLGLKDRPEDLGLYFRKGLGLYEYQTDPRSYEKHRRPNLATLWSSKGCVARCTFCQRSTKGYRVPLIAAFEEHLVMLKERFDVGFININDENFASNPEYTADFARMMKKHDMLWLVSGVRVSSIEYEDVKFFKEHGCVSMKFGVETGSQKIMNVMEKKFTVERVYQVLKHCSDMKMNSPLAVMVGMPGETNETAMATGKFLGRVSHMQGLEPEHQRISIFYALPLTGTPLYIYGQQTGMIGRSLEEEEEYLLSVSGTGTSKVNYVNLNGSRIYDVIFWDWLLKLEASRTFFEMDDKEPIDRESFMYRTLVSKENHYKRREVMGRPLTVFEVVSRIKMGVPTGIKAKAFYSVDNFLENHVVFNRALHKLLPRWLMYGAVKNLVYAAYLLQRLVAKMAGRDFNLYKPRARVKPLEGDAMPGKVSIGLSLRTVVRDREAVEARRKTRTEENQDILSIGL